MTINELKEKLMGIISGMRLLSNPRRIETICRAQINRPSFTMILGDHCIYLEKDDRKIIIEDRCGKNNDGYGRPAYETAFNESEKILDQLREQYEEALCSDRQAV